MKAYVTDDGKLLLIPEFDKDEQFLTAYAKDDKPRVSVMYPECKLYLHMSHVIVALQEPQP